MAERFRRTLKGKSTKKWHQMIENFILVMQDSEWIHYLTSFYWKKKPADDDYSSLPEEIQTNP